MTTRTGILEKHYNVKTYDEAFELYVKDIGRKHQELTTTLQIPYTSPNHPPLPSLQEIF